MSAEWPLRKVTELQDEGILLVEDGNHGEYRPRPSEFQTQGTTFVRAADINDNGRILFEDADCISEVAVERIRKGKALPGDVLFSHKGTVGKLALAPPDAPPFVCSPQTTFWRTLDPDRLDRHFLYAFMRSEGFRRQWFARKGETDMADYVSLTAQRTFAIPLPPVDEQRAIAGVVAPLDDKIEANRALNETLEATCQAVFRSWFVDFDPVVAKSEGRRPLHLADHVAALFPDRFEESPIGPVPAGWRLGLVGDEYALTMGQSPPGSTYNEEGGGLPFYQGRTDFRGRYPVQRVYCTAPTRIAEEGDTLVSVRAPVGDTNQALEQCALGRGVGAVRHKRRKTSFTYYQMGSLREDFDVFNGYGTLFGSINKSDFARLRVVAPSPELVERFEEVAGPLDATLRANTLEAQTLAALRDALLPRLLSAELRVRQAEKLVEGAV